MNAATARVPKPVPPFQPPASTALFPVTIADVLAWIEAGVSATGALQEALRRHGFKPIPFGRTCGVDKSTVTAAINGIRRPPEALLFAFAEEFKGSVQDWRAVFNRALTEPKPPTAD